jgi:3-oxoacyl-[acyl-carrier-protein] synthase-3
VPPRILSNADLATMVDTSDEWIMQRLGIRERHLAEPGMATSDMAVEAARRCLSNRGIMAGEVEVVIVATVTPDMLFPATACLVQDKLGAHGAWGFDLSAACSGFLYALQVGAKLVESGAQSKVDVVDHRLYRPNHLRHIRRWCWCGPGRTRGRGRNWADRLLS